MHSSFALVDCNNFYASCERSFSPKLEAKPVIVLSNNDGCVIARSNEAKTLGIKMAQPVFQCKDIIRKHAVHVYSANFPLYGDMSCRIMTILSRFTPYMEIYSIDEAFLSFAHIATKNIKRYANNIKATIKQSTGIPISIGIAPTKTLAKIANKIAKTSFNGVFNITNHPDTDKFLGKIKVEDVWGIGRQYGNFLNMNQIYTALDLKNVRTSWAKKHLSVTGLRTVLELRGTLCIPLQQTHLPNKTIFTSRSFRNPLKKLRELKQAIAKYTAIACEKLRSQKSCASQITIFIATNRFKNNRQYSNSITLTLNMPSTYTPDFTQKALQGLDRIFKKGYEYKKAGVLLGRIIPAGQEQLNLFSPSTSPKYHQKQSLMKVIDKINAKWGQDTIKSAAVGMSPRWQYNQLNRSKRFTTKWEEIMEVKTSPHL